MGNGNEDQGLAVDLLGESGATAPEESSSAPTIRQANERHLRIARAIRSLITYPRVAKLYPPGHQRIEAHFTELLHLLEEAFGDEKVDSIELTVAGNRIEVDGEAIEEDEELTTAFALKLRRRQIGSLTLRRGIDRTEVEGLAALLTADHKELLRRGGAANFLPEECRARIGVATFATHQEGEGRRGGGGELPHGVAAILEERLSSPETAECLGRLRDRYDSLIEAADVDLEAEFCDFDDLVYEVFGRPEWAKLPESDVGEAFDVLLKMIEDVIPDETLPESTAARSRVESIRSFFRTVGPAELLGSEGEREMDDEAEMESPVSYAAGGLEKSDSACDVESARAAEAIRNQLGVHNHEENSLLILCELMVSADDIDEYERRRSIFLGAFADQRYSSGSVARLLRYIAIDLPSPRFENRDNLVHAVFDSTSDEEALVLFLESMTNQPDVARPILSRLVMRQDPFPLLVRLLQAERLKPFRRVLTDKLLHAARVKQEALNLWARRNRALFFHSEVFEPLFQHAPELLGVICKEILTDGGSADRALLINRLKEEKTESALRLLVLGMPCSDEPCDELLLRALSGFRHPLAIAALREIVHRSNTKDVRVAEALGALRALGRARMDEGSKFLWEVVQRRSCLLPFYRKPLRLFASQILQGMDN